jgi:hypothetical protein
MLSPLALLLGLVLLVALLQNVAAVRTSDSASETCYVVYKQPPASSTDDATAAVPKRQVKQALFLKSSKNRKSMYKGDRYDVVCKPRKGGAKKFVRPSSGQIVDTRIPQVSVQLEPGSQRVRGRK